MTVTSQGRQFDRLATMWLGDVEIFRTSTAEPKPAPGITWNYMKDMTAYHSLWTKDQKVIFDLGNLINEKYTGPFNVTISAHFFNMTFFSPHPKPADLVIPVSALKSNDNQPSAFSFPNDKAAVVIEKPPRNVKAAIFTVAATAQGEEEFWWSNVPQSASDFFNYSDGNRLPGMGSFREVRVLIDGEIAGIAWPFPVIFTGGISPPLHRPMVGLQAFDLREYEIDMTPWLGVLCDGSQHTISMEVVAVDDGVGDEASKFVTVPSRWVLSGKLFLWLDEDGRHVTRGSKPRVSINPINYQAEVGSDHATKLTYTQTINRSYTVEAQVESLNNRRLIKWEQSYTMKNTGLMKDYGYWHNVNATYDGHGSSYANRDLSPVLQTVFSYPISTVYSYKSPDPEKNASLTIYAQLEQDIDFSVLGHTPFVTGLEPFLFRLGSVSAIGTNLKTSRQGSAIFSQFGEEYSKGHGDMKQNYQLRAANPNTRVIPLAQQGVSNPWEVTLGPMLYRRSVEIVNETKLVDEEHLWDHALEPRGTPHHAYSRTTPEFCVFPLHALGGTNVFRHDTGVDIVNQIKGTNQGTPVFKVQPGIVGQKESNYSAPSVDATKSKPDPDQLLANSPKKNS